MTAALEDETFEFDRTMNQKARSRRLSLFDVAIVSRPRHQRFQLLDAPEDHFAGRRGKDAAAPWNESHRVDVVVVARENPDRLALGEIPQDRLVIRRARERCSSVR